MGAPGPARCYDAIEIGGQRYVWVGDYAHTRRDGKISIMASWQTNCRQCSAQFILHHPQRPAPTYPVRNCPRCVVAIRTAKAETALNPATPSQSKQPAQHPAKEAREAYRTQPAGQTPRVTEQEQHHIPITLQDQHTLNTTITTRNNTNATASGQGEARTAISSHETPINTASQPPPVQPPNPATAPRRVFTDR